MNERLDRSKRAERIWSGEVDLVQNNSLQDLVETNTGLVKRFIEEGLNKGNLSEVDELLAQDYVDHSLPTGAPQGREGYKASVNMFRSAFPDIQYTLDQILAEGDRLAVRLTGRGTHQGQFLGLPPAGKQVTFAGMTFLRFRDGKVIERWDITDIPGLMQQLRVGPGQPPPSH
jgi:steroid delta-isomerase-like uncharacterized protein